MKTLFIIAGHTNVIEKSGFDVGASNPFDRNRPEGVLTVEFRDLLVDECRKLGLNPRTDANQNALQATMNWLKGLVFTPDSLTVDIHWNSGSATANGTEVIIPDNATKKERDLAQDTFNVLSKYWRGRRILRESETPRKRLGIFRPNMEQILIEICFISNSSDMNTYEKVKRSVAKEIAQVIHKHFVKQDIQSNTYIVKSGDSLSRIAKQNNTTVAKIITNNKLTTDVIRVGQKLIL